MMRTTRKVEARLTGSSGEALAWHTDAEKGKLSVATKGPRVVLSPTQAREFAAWLIKAANEIDANAGLGGLEDAIRAAGERRVAREQRHAAGMAGTPKTPWRY